MSAETSNNSNRTEKEAVQDEKNPLKTVSAKDVERRNEKQERQEEKQPDREQISTVTQPIESISEDNQTEQAEAFVREEEDSREEEVLEQEEELLEDEEKVIDLEDKRTEKSINYQSQDEQEEKEISLTQFFARKDENRAARMKIYIVQENDSLNDIAEKYEVSVSQLLRLNQLEPHQDVYEGQLLSIPVKQNSQS